MKDNDIRISVVMTTYNGEKYVEDQLISLTNQTRLPDEIIIFDDCSTDRTVHIVQKFIEMHSNVRLKLSVNKSNKGWQKNFMDAISEAKGEIILLADQDDIWIQDKIAKCSNLLESHDEIDLLTCNFSVFNMRRKKAAEEDQEAGMNNDKALFRFEIDKDFYRVNRPGCTYCFRKSFFDDIKSYWQPGMAHDQLLWSAAILKHSLYNYNEVLIKFRRHDSNASGRITLNVSREKRIARIDNNIRLIQQLYQLYISQIDNVEANVVKEYLSYEAYRRDFLETGSLLKWMGLVKKYRKYSYSMKSLFKDLYIAKRG